MMWKLTWLVALQQDNEQVFDIIFVIGDTTICKTYVIKFVIFLALLKLFFFFLSFLK